MECCKRDCRSWGDNGSVGIQEEVAATASKTCFALNSGASATDRQKKAFKAGASATNGKMMQEDARGLS